MIASLWKLTLDPAGTPLVILNYGDLIDAPLVFAGQRGVSVIPLIRAATPKLRNGKNLSVALSFRRHLPADTWPLALAGAAAGALSALGMDIKPLRVESSGVTDYEQYANCLVSAGSGAIDPDEQYYTITYSMVCTTRSVVTP